MRKCTCYLFLRSNKSQSGQKNQPQSGSNQSFFPFIIAKHHFSHTANSHWPVKVHKNRFHFRRTVEINDLLPWKHNKSIEMNWKLHRNNEESWKVQYCRPFLRRKEDVLKRKIISLESMFTGQPLPMLKYSSN